jgi:hypothetical protein
VIATVNSLELQGMSSGGVDLERCSFQRKRREALQGPGADGIAIHQGLDRLVAVILIIAKSGAKIEGKCVTARHKPSDGLRNGRVLVLQEDSLCEGHPVERRRVESRVRRRESRTTGLGVAYTQSPPETRAGIEILSLIPAAVGPLVSVLPKRTSTETANRHSTKVGVDDDQIPKCRRGCYHYGAKKKEAHRTMRQDTPPQIDLVSLEEEGRSLSSTGSDGAAGKGEELLLSKAPRKSCAFSYGIVSDRRRIGM